MTTPCPLLRLTACLLSATGLATMCASPQVSHERPRTTARTHARVSLQADRIAASPGQPLTLALSFDIDPGWHLYWNGALEAGMHPKFDLHLPEGWTAQEPLWPAPRRIILPGDILTHAYEHQLVLLIPVRVPDAAAPGSQAVFEADVDWSACADVCVLESGSARLVLPISREPDACRSRDAERIDAARARVPLPLSAANGAVRAAVEENTLLIHADGAHRLAFYPGEGCVETPNLVRDGTAEGGSLRVALRPDPKGHVVGVVMVAGADGSERHYLLNLPIVESSSNDEGERE